MAYITLGDTASDFASTLAAAQKEAYGVSTLADELNRQMTDEANKRLDAVRNNPAYAYSGQVPGNISYSGGIPYSKDEIYFEYGPLAASGGADGTTSILGPRQTDLLGSLEARLDEIKKYAVDFSAAAMKANGVPATQDGPGAIGESFKVRNDLVHYAQDVANTLDRWKWWEMKSKTPTNFFDNWWKEETDALKEFAHDIEIPKIPPMKDIDDLITYLKWGIGIFVGFSIWQAWRK